jgi:hypothetical protein
MRGILVCLLLIAVLPAFGQQNPPRPPPEELIRQFDRNGDGRISRDEAPLSPW